MLHGSQDIANSTEEEKKAIYNVQKSIEHLMSITGSVIESVKAIVESLEKLYKQINLLRDTSKSG